jgi:hypothetical protein
MKGLTTAINSRLTRSFFCGSKMGMQPSVPKDTPAQRRERRERREAEAAAKRARALALQDAGATCDRIGQELGVSTSRAFQILAKAKRLRDDPRWYHVLPVRVQNLLYHMELRDLPEAEAARAIAQYSRRELLKQPNFGKGGLATIIAWLGRHGLQLSETPNLTDVGKIENLARVPR